MSWAPHKLVLVPVDFSDSSADAVSTALDLVAKPADLHVVHVLVPLERVSPAGMWGPLENDSAWDAKTRQHLGTWLKERGFAGVTQVVLIGDPGLEVADYAQERNVDLIVLPSHGYHGIKRALLGSVAERIIRHASCPVLVLRRRDAQ